MLTARTPVRSTPRTHEATSATSAVCMCTSRTAGSEMAGSPSTEGSPGSSGTAVPAAMSHTSDGRAATRSTARRAPADGQLVRVLRTQTTRFPNATDEQNALDESCAVLSADASGQHVLVQAFSFGRIDNGVFTALLGVPSSSVPLAAAAW
jgi:hypothetical protein